MTVKSDGDSSFGHLLPLLRDQDRETTLIEIVERISRKKCDHNDILLISNYLVAPPQISIDCFWTSLKAALNCYKIEKVNEDILKCLDGTVEQVLEEAVFMKPEEETLKMAFEHIGAEMANICLKRPLYTKVMANLLSSICQLAKFGRKNSKTPVHLLKTALKLEFPEPLEKSLVQILKETVDFGGQQAASMILSCLSDCELDLDVVIAIVTVISNEMVNKPVDLMNRDVINGFCSKMLSKIDAKESHCLIECFLNILNTAEIEPNLAKYVELSRKSKSEVSIWRILDKFQDPASIDMVLEHLYKPDSKFLVNSLEKWLYKSDSTVNQSIPLKIWRFLLTKAATGDKEIALRLTSSFLSGLKIISNQASANVEMDKLIDDTVEVFSDENICDYLLKCFKCLFILDHLTSQRGKIDKIFEKSLKNCSELNGSAEVLSCLVVFCAYKGVNDEKSLKIFRKIISKKSIDDTPIDNMRNLLDFLIENFENIENFVSKQTFLSICTKFDDKLVGSPLVGALLLMERQSWLDDYLKEQDLEALMQNLADSQSLPLISNMSRTLMSKIFHKISTIMAKFNCNFVPVFSEFLRKESDFDNFQFFQHFDVTSFLRNLEKHEQCKEGEKVLHLARLTAIACTWKDENFSLLSDFLLKRLNGKKKNHSISLVLCQCLLQLHKKSRKLGGKEGFRKFIDSVEIDTNDSSIFEDLDEKFNENSNRILADFCLALLNWRKFGQNRINVNIISNICQQQSSAGSSCLNSIWSQCLLDLMSRVVKTNDSTGDDAMENLEKSCDILLSLENWQISSSADSFVTVWQTIFKNANRSADRLLRNIIYLNHKSMVSKSNDQFRYLLTAYFKVMASNSCSDNETHTNEVHENAIWLFNSDGTIKEPSTAEEQEEPLEICNGIKMGLVLYHSIIAQPELAFQCLPAASQYDFFNSQTSNGHVNFDLLLAIVVGASRKVKWLSQSPDHYTAFCTLLNSLLKLRTNQDVQDKQTKLVPLSNVIHHVIICLSTAFTTLLEYQIEDDHQPIYFQVC